MDRNLRDRERKRLLAGDEDPAALRRAYIRAGRYDQQRVALAAAFGMDEAQGVSGLAPIKCSCRLGNESRPACYVCAGTGVASVPTDFISAVKLLAEHIGLELLIQWAHDCWSRHAALRQEVVHEPTPDTTWRAIALVCSIYRASGHSAVERAWQRRRLCELLLPV